MKVGRSIDKDSNAIRILHTPAGHTCLQERLLASLVVRHGNW
jgi:hypothetical protein